MLQDNNNYDDMNQGIDRITQILQRQSTPVAASPLYSQASPLPINILQAINYADRSYPGAMSRGNFVQDAQIYLQNQQNAEINQAGNILKAYEMKLKMGDAQTKALDDKIKMFTGDDAEGKALFLEQLHADPDPIDPTNSYQVMTKLAGIKKKTGYESPDLQLDKLKKSAEIQKLQSEVTKNTSKPSQLQRSLSNKIAEDIQSVNQDSANVRVMEDKVTELEDLFKGGLDTGKWARGVAYLDPLNLKQNTRDLQKFEQAVNAIALPKTASLKGSTSDKDVKFVKDAFANAGTSNEANKYAVDVARRYVARQKAIINIYNEAVSDPSYSDHPELFYKDLQKAINAMPSLQEEIEGKKPDANKPPITPEEARAELARRKAARGEKQ